jgi:site-specific DNA-methyltransferase (adenine-specific)
METPTPQEIDIHKGQVKWRCDLPIFTSAHVEWGTPPDLYESLNKEFHFDFDPCPDRGVWDGREVSWEGKRVFCNPPYGRGIDKWLVKGHEADLAVFLLPARTDTIWFHDYALNADEIRFFRGRLKFTEQHVAPRDSFMGNAAPFPSMLVIYRKSLL